MTTIKNVILGIMAAILVLAPVSCSKEFRELSKNPNTSDEALPEALLAPALTNVVKSNMSRARRLTNELMQVTVLMGDQEGRIFRYDVRASEADYLWNNWYVQLTNFIDMYNTAEELYAVESDKFYNTLMGISLICQSWVFSMLTDTYGDIPYFEACKGREGVLMPAFDKQEVIYEDIFLKLERANELLADGAVFPDDKTICDPVFHGDYTKWRKFGNSLYLRLLLRVSAVMEVADKISEMIVESPDSYPIMTSNDDSAILMWTGETPYTSPFYTLRDADWRQNVMAAFFLDNLNNWNDPRRAVWADTYASGWEGVESGYPVGAEVYAKSRIRLALKTDPRLGNMLNYAELEFILAEIAVKGYASIDAATHYENGIEASMAMWDCELPDGYMDNSLVMWNEDEQLDDKMSKIMLQKYYALFYTDLEQWFEYRRTGYPIIPKGAGLLNGGIMPARLNYPVYIQSTNRDNYFAAVADQGEDNVYTRVWWQTEER